MPSFADNTTVDERWHIANWVNSLCERDPDGKPLPIDPLTDKPKINFVLSSGVVEGEISADPENEMWQNEPARIVAMGGQITHKPRNFVNRIDDIWVKSALQRQACRFMFQWDDRTKSVAEGKLPWPPTQVNVDVKEQEPKTGEEGSIARIRISIPSTTMQSRWRPPSSGRSFPRLLSHGICSEATNSSRSTL